MINPVGLTLMCCCGTLKHKFEPAGDVNEKFMVTLKSWGFILFELSILYKDLCQSVM